MKSFPRFLALLTLLCLSLSAFAQLGSSNKVKWSARIEPTDVRAGESAQIIITADIEKGFHIYGLRQPEGPTSTELTIAENPFVKSNGESIQPEPHVAHDPGFDKEIGTLAGTVSFAIPIQVDPKAKGKVEVVINTLFQVCDDRSCLSPETSDIKVEFPLADGEVRADRTAAITTVPQQPGTEKPIETTAKTSTNVDDTTTQIEKAKANGLLAYFLLAFSFGLLALLTPCVWPMVPITVSFFAKKTSDDGKKNLKGAFAYCIGIISTFTLIGLAVTLIFGSTGIQGLAANPYVNLGMAVVFIVLAISLFGVFEVALPASWLSKIQRGSTRGGILGPILMGLAFSLTTFTCTVPFIGTILVSATKGDLLFPIVGMIGFSLAFAIPFFFLALFPQYLAKLPRSGSWLSAVKVYMGFLEIAAAFKFLSNAELVWHLGILTFPVFMWIWAGIFLLAALYLFGLLAKKQQIGRIRIGFAACTILVSGYCVAAIYGAPTGMASGFLPPDPYPSRLFLSYEDALKQAKAENRPIFINFTGYTCTNCRVMEKNFLPRPEIKSRIDKCITVELFTDDGSPENNANADLRVKLTNSASNPTYVILTPDGKPVKVFQGLALNADSFVKFLDDGLAEAKKTKN